MKTSKSSIPFKKRLAKSDLIKNGGRYLLLLPAIIFIVVFAYLPMIGIIIAFEDYDPAKGIFGSKFVGFENFKFFANFTFWSWVVLVGGVVGIGGSAAYYAVSSIPFTASNIVFMFLMGIASAIGAMIGYDKIIQTITQIKSK